MDWKTVSFGIVDGKRGQRERDGIRLEGVDLKRAKRQELYIEGVLAAETWPEVDHELVEFWTRLASTFEACLPAEPPLDLVIVEIEPEGGQLKAYFNDSKKESRSSPLVFSAIVPVMDEEYHALPDPEDDADEFEEQITAIRQRARESLLASLRQPAAAEAMDGLLSRHTLKLGLRWEDSDSDETVSGPRS